MAVRIEYLIVIISIIILAFGYDYKVFNQHNSTKIVSKNLEFYDTNFTKVDTSELISSMYVKYGFMKSKILEGYKIVYHDTQIIKLQANKAISKAHSIRLDGNVSIYQKDGISCFSDIAIYNKNRLKIIIPTSFVSHMGNNTMLGRDMEYDMNTKVLFAKNVTANLEIEKNSEE